MIKRGRKPNISVNDSRKQSGSHYTPTILADFVAERIVEVSKLRFEESRIKVLDPAVGDGELLLSLLSRIPKEILLKLEVYGFDTDFHAIKTAEERIRERFPDVILFLENENFLEYALENEIGTLFEDPERFFDIIIANPPYVRTQVMGAKLAGLLAAQFGLSGRVDLYYAFIQAMSKVLVTGGIAGIIVSNRFMTTKSGASIRQSIPEDFDIIHVWDLGDTRLFEAAVLPAVLLLSRKNGESLLDTPKFTSIYTTNEGEALVQCENPLEALKSEGIIRLPNGQNYFVQHGILSTRGVWRIETDNSNNWLDTVEKHTFCTFGDIGKIRVGVKTTADKVFIREDWHQLPTKEQPEVLRPLITHHIARRYRANPREKQKKILYTHLVKDGKRVTINLDDYPQTRNYLLKYKVELEGREYVAKANRKWFEIWVPQDPDAWHYPKVVFWDIAEKPTFWIDVSGSVVNGDCYWFVEESNSNPDLLWLALAIGNSSFIETFYDHKFHNKLYAGRRRFMTQYVEQFPVPNPNDEAASEIVKTAKVLYETVSSPLAGLLEKQLDELIWKAFGLPVEEGGG